MNWFENRNKWIWFMCLALIGGTLVSCSVKQRIRRADKKFEIGEYYDAGNIYQQSYKRVPAKDRTLRGYVAFRQGECYYYLNNQKAVNAYRNAIRNHYADSVVYLHLAQALQYQGKYQEALKYYDIYAVAHPTDYVSESGRLACRLMAEWKREVSRYRVGPEQQFNQKRTSNFAPQFVGNDADVLMFTTNRTPASKKSKKLSSITGTPVHTLFTARKNAVGKWEEIEPTEGLTSDNAEAEEAEASDAEGDGADVAMNQKDKTTPDIGVCCFTSDGRTMYFTYSKPINGQDQGAQIYRSDRASGTWSEPQRVKLFEDSTITCAHPSLSRQGDTLYFVSDAEGGIGGKDIWYAELAGDGWGIPVNMGPEINTPSDELFPYIREDGVLYFSSRGHAGYGGLDIFKAYRNEAGEWQLFNMGQPFNSQGDDFGITFEAGKEQGYFSTNRGQQKKGYDEIYWFYLPEMVFAVEGVVTDNNGENLSDAVLRLVGNDGTNQKVQIKRDGTYKIKLKKDVRYVMLARSRGYLNQKQELTTENLNDTRIFTQNFMLMPISRPIKMDNIFYEFGKYELTKDSEAGLQQLVKLLNDNPNITIELSAHTDRVGQAEANRLLSEKRAESVVRYLTEHGIDAERLTAVGYGKERPVVVDKSLHDQYKFLPIEQVLSEDFIDTLSKSEQEICNQINRRTEFKVLSTTYKLY